MFVLAVVVTGHGAGAEIYVLANRRVAQVGEVPGFRATAQARVLYLNKIADDGLVLKYSFRAQVCKGPTAQLDPMSESSISEWSSRRRCHLNVSS